MTSSLYTHTFIKSDNFAKQVPLVFVIMSGKWQGDYGKVFKGIKELFTPDPEVEEAIMDFKAAMWTSARNVFPSVHLHVYTFHWAQAVWLRCKKSV